MASFSSFSLKFSKSVEKHLELCQQSSPVFCFSISKSLSVLKLSSDRNFSFVHVCDCSLKFLDLPCKILVLNLKTLLGRLSLIESTGHFIKSCVGVNNRALKELSSFIQLSLTLDCIFQICSGITKVKL